MSLHIRLAIGLVAAGLTFAPAAWAAQEHSHEGGAGSLSELTLNNGAKWQTDAPLRKGMEGIRHDLAAALPRIHDGKLPAEGYGQLAEKVHGHVEYMVGNCKLPPEADAQLHLVLAQMMDGADAMKSGPDRTTGAVKIVQALDAYGRHFDHPAWSSPAH